MPRILTTADIAGFRSRLCDVAAQLFIELGQEGFNMRELAKRLGVSAMTPYRYFKDKDAILSEVRARAFSRFADRLEEVLDGTNGTLAAAYAQFAIQEHAQYRLMFDLAQTPPGASPAVIQQEQRARFTIVAHMRNLIERGVLSGDAERLALVLWSTLHGVATLYLTGKLSSQDFRTVLSESVNLLAGAPNFIAPGMTMSVDGLELDQIQPWWTPPAVYQPVAAAGE